MYKPSWRRWRVQPRISIPALSGHVEPPTTPTRPRFPRPDGFSMTSASAVRETISPFRVLPKDGDTSSAWLSASTAHSHSPFPKPDSPSTASTSASLCSPGISVDSMGITATYGYSPEGWTGKVQESATPDFQTRLDHHCVIGHSHYCLEGLEEGRAFTGKADLRKPQRNA